ncbi:MAG: MFS transporter, partial [Caulobacteraceae bacterium]
MASTSPTADTGGHITGFGSKPYRSYVLSVLLFIYILNFVDRGLLAVVGPVLKPVLGVSDTVWGLLTGAGFAVVYTLIGIPVSRIAEVRHRVWIMTICVAIWSVMTALCGLAREIVIGGTVIGLFWVILACRIGVAVGEAGCTPPATSLISDYYPASKRSTALGYYAMGVTLGTVLANLVGGPVA